MEGVAHKQNSYFAKMPTKEKSFKYTTNRFAQLSVQFVVRFDANDVVVVVVVAVIVRVSGGYSQLLLLVEFFRARQTT